MLTDSLVVSRNLIEASYIKILATIAVLIFAYLVYLITITSLKKLKTEILPSYPFDLFILKGGHWSIGYFLTLILFLGLIVYLLINGKFFLGPA